MTRVGEINAPPASSVKKITRGVESILAAVDSAFVYFRMDRTGGGVDSRGSRLRFRLFSGSDGLAAPRGAIFTSPVCVSVCLGVSVCH